ncbi:MAG: imidazole glycerol phosphate synthase subunit HisH [Nitrospirae bacterium]|nr:imidazole glycerol phosphate synthase subunit HisH [Nitrospirota bacterium]
MIAVIDYGMGNLRSVSKALERVGGEVKITSSVEDIEKAEAIILPGVGAFYQAMENLKSRGIVVPLCQAIDSGKLFLGICLGLQLLFEESEEGNCKGLNVLPGKVKKFQIEDLKVPHMGWNGVRFKDSQLSLLEGIPEGSYFYFAHSYYVEPTDEEVILTMTEYGIPFTSAVRKDNIFGVQFHPEKSGEKGLRLLENFVRISKE